MPLTLADLTAAPAEITFEGKVFKLRPPDQLEQGMFARWLEQRAREFVMRATDVPPETQDRLIRNVASDAAAGRYDFGGDTYTQALGTPLGMAKMMALIFRKTMPELGSSAEEWATKIVAQKITEAVAVMQAELLDDPKARAAVLASVGLPPDYLDPKSPPTSDTSSPSSSTPPSETPPACPPSSG